jgi:beta-galactosidase
VRPTAEDWVPLTVINSPSARIEARPYPSGPGLPAWTNEREPADIDHAWFRRSFEVPAEWDARAVWIRFGMIEGSAVLFVNGQEVGELHRPAWEVDITHLVSPGAPVEVWVYCTRIHGDVRGQGSSDLIVPSFLESRGKTRKALGVTYDATLFTRGRAAWLGSPFVLSGIDRQELVVEVDVLGDLPLDSQLSGWVREAGGDNAVVAEIGASPAARGTNRVVVPFPGGVPWQLEAPHLYVLDLRLQAGRDELDRVEGVRFGFRHVSVDGRRVLLNGKRSRWRFRGPFTTDVLLENPQMVRFYRDIGYNVFQIQPNSGHWWSVHASTYQVHDERLLDYCDAEGIGVTLPLPPAAGGPGKPVALLSDPATAAQYRDEVARFMERYRNHPCIQAWTIAMNVLDLPTYAHNMSPFGMGQEPTAAQLANERIAAVIASIEIAHELDPTRPVYAHAGGNPGGDLASGNQHLNFIPLAEREAWPSHWAEHGVKPWSADECGQPYLGNFALKRYHENGWVLDVSNPELAFTEFAAMEYGDWAYLVEPEQVRRSPREGVANLEVFGLMHFQRPEGYRRVPAVERFMAEYGRRTNRAWRAYDVQGWVSWIIDWGAGGGPTPPATDKMVEAYTDTMHPLLVFWAGEPEPYRRDHNVLAGETVTKRIVAVYDGPADFVELAVDWVARDLDGSIVAKGCARMTVAAGGIEAVPVDIHLPAIAAKTHLAVELQVAGAVDQPGSSDRIDLTVWPRRDRRPALAAATLLDPEGESSWVRRHLRDGLGASDVLVVGRKALAHLDRMPFDADQIAQGMRVLVLEQRAEDLLRLGFRVQERGCRRAFIREPDHHVLSGLDDADLSDWSGDATLLPPHHPPRYWAHRPVALGAWPQRTARWGNHGNVASVLIETPHRGNFRPLVDCEFDLAYTPLLEFRHGLGSVLFCQLDVTGRTSDDPVATLLAERLVGYLTTPLDDVGRPLSIEVEGSVGEALRGLGFEQAEAAEAADAVRVVDLDRAAAFLSEAKSYRQTILFVARSQHSGAQVESDGSGSAPIGFGPAEQFTAAATLSPVPVAGGTVGPALLRWRCPVVGHRSADGAVLSEGCVGDVHWVGCGVPIDAADDADPTVGRISKLRLRQLHNRLLSFLGVRSDEALARRVTTLMGVPGAGIDPESAAQTRELLVADVEVAGPYAAHLLDGPAGVDEGDWKKVDLLRASGDVTGYAGQQVANRIDLGHALGSSPRQGQEAFVRASLNVLRDEQVTVSLDADGPVELRLDDTVISTEPSAAAISLASGAHSLFARVLSGAEAFSLSWTFHAVDDTDTEHAWMLPYNPAGDPLYTSPMSDSEDPYLFYTW